MKEDTMNTGYPDAAPDSVHGGRFEIDPETGIAFGEFHDTVQPGALLASLHDVVRLQGARSRLFALADLRGATVHWHDGEEVAFRRALYGRFPARIAGRCALLAPTRDLDKPAALVGAGTLLENLYLRIDARLFHDFGQAMRWLLQDNEAQAGANEHRPLREAACVPLIAGRDAAPTSHCC
jgi:hypothetical protein